MLFLLTIDFAVMQYLLCMRFHLVKMCLNYGDLDHIEIEDIDKMSGVSKDNHSFGFG